MLWGRGQVGHSGGSGSQNHNSIQRLSEPEYPTKFVLNLRWQPSEPPTGQIAKYKVKYGPLADPMDWKAELEVANQTN